MNNSLNYGLLLKQFLDGAMSAEEFQTIYLDRFKNERPLDGPLFEILDDLFGDVNSFTTDQQLFIDNPEFYLDEAELREKVQRVVNRLSNMNK